MTGNETLTVEADEAGMRLDRWFRAHYPDVSFTHLQKLLRSGQVRVNGGRVKTSTRLEPGQAVRVPPLAEGRDGATQIRPRAPGQGDHAQHGGAGTRRRSSALSTAFGGPAPPLR